MYDLNFRMFIHKFTRDYAAFADLVESAANPWSSAVVYFNRLHAGLIRDLGLDDDATPADVITAVYAYYRAHGGDATERMICALPSPGAVEWFEQFATRPAHPIAG